MWDCYAALAMTIKKGAMTHRLCHCEAHPSFVVRPFRVVHEAKASHYIFEVCSVIARHVSAEAIWMPRRDCHAALAMTIKKGSQ